MGRGAGRGTAGDADGRLGLGVGDGGAGVFAGAGFSVDFVVGSSFSDFFFADGETLAFGFGVASSSSSAAFLAGDFLGFSSSSVDFLAGDFFGFGESPSSPSSAGVFFGFGFGVGVGVAFFFFDFDFRVAGFGLAFVVSLGAGEATARISSGALRFFFSSSPDCAYPSVPRMAAKARIAPRKTRSRITAGERNRDECVINLEANRVVAQFGFRNF